MTPELAVAPPEMIVKAWEVGVMGGGMNANFIRLVQEGEIVLPIPDPIYHRGQMWNPEGWHSASGILNPSAIRSMAGWLGGQGLRVPDETQAAWDENLRRHEIREEIEKAVRDILRRMDEEEGATLADYALAVHNDIGFLADDEEEKA